MSDQNRDDFYEGPPIEEPERWHDWAVFERRDGDTAAGSGSTAQFPTSPTPDPSLSRAVDREDAGVPVMDTGFDRAGEGPAAGPLEPDGQAG